jgi:elongator complex protein 1
MHSQAADADNEPTSRSSDNTIRISWRGDGAFFVVSALFAGPAGSASQRRLRFYSREAVLQSTSEPTPGLEGSLAWQPSGSIIASSANNGRQIVFFERNGLRRYEFDLKEERPEWQCTIRQLAWNSDSTILAVWVERHHEDGSSSNIVQLWRRNN